MKNSKEMSTPICTFTKLDKDASGKSVDEKLYRGMIVSLLYLTANTSDIVFIVCLYACFQASPKESHLQAVKQIIRYVKGTFALVHVFKLLLIYCI